MESKKSCEMLPSFALKLKMFNQGSKVPLMRIFIPKTPKIRKTISKKATNY